MKKNISKGISHGRVAENRRAKFDYAIIDTIEAGLILLGSEVKSLRLGRASIAESYDCLLYTSPSPRDLH
mgnify:CR=1 FL=1